MWFKNLSLLRLPADYALAPEDLAAGLGERRLRSPGPLELETHGFVPPFAQGEALAHSVGEATLLCLGTESRLLPASVVNDAIADKVAQYEEKTGRKPGKRRRSEFREEVLAELLPRAFIRRVRTQAYWDQSLRVLAIDSASDKAAERLASALREGLGRLPARPWTTDRPVALALTEWLLSGELPEGFELGDECEFKDPADERSVIRCRRHDLTADEIREHARAGQQISQLALVYAERIAFVLDVRLKLRKIRFLDLVTDRVEGGGEADEASLRDAEFALMSGELRELLKQLMELFPPLDGWPADG
jgi:recombination associated protein RdgC